MPRISINNNGSITGNISSLYGLPHFSASSACTNYEISEEEERQRKKKLIKSMLKDDNYLLQEIVADLRRDKIKQLKDNRK